MRGVKAGMVGAVDRLDDLGGGLWYGGFELVSVWSW